MIILNLTSAAEQISALLKTYPGLKIEKSDLNEVRLLGNIHIYRTALDFTLDNYYDIEIRIPIDSSSLPIAIDIGNAIEPSYPHRYVNGELCLETDTAVKLRFIDGFNLLKWMDEYVEPYYFTYEYFMRFGFFPFGERPHGLEGIINTYQEIFNEVDIGKTLRLMMYSAYESYRGHINCPCGCNKRLRICHGKYIFPLMTNSDIKELIQKDVESIRKAITENASRNNC
jgi:hypothetical protein